jgi:hypothetical protein
VVIFTYIGLKHRPKIYGRYLHFRILKFPLIWGVGQVPVENNFPKELKDAERYSRLYGSYTIDIPITLRMNLPLSSGDW